MNYFLCLLKCIISLLIFISVLFCISNLDNCRRAAHNLTHFDVTFPRYYQLMLPHIVMHHVTPVRCENGANTNDAVLCQNFAVILCLPFPILVSKLSRKLAVK